MDKKILLAWSGGKDSMWAMHRLQQDDALTIEALITTFAEDTLRTGMHGVPQSLIQAQADSLGLQLVPVLQPSFPTNELYEHTFNEAISPFRDEVKTIAYGDLFLEDIRAYRDNMMAKIGLSAIYPLWGRDTTALAQEIVNSDYEITVVCVDTHQLDSQFIGRKYDADFLADLPENVDPCGENGEFHTFVSDGVLFQRPVKFSVAGNFMQLERFLTLDLIAESS